MQQIYSQTIRSLIASIRPYDAIEEAHQADALNWIDSGAPLCRTAKPATPPKHLVTYSILIDLNQRVHPQKGMAGDLLDETRQIATSPGSKPSVEEIHQRSLLLVDHKQAGLWLPTGGHVEIDEHPSTTAQRELREELGISLPLLQPGPLFLTVTETVGSTAGHTDVSLWYVFVANSSENYTHDHTEFHDTQWFALDHLPLERTDPHLSRFCSKLLMLPQLKR
jgi:8-oxo-dGTP diphosphatase